MLKKILKILLTRKSYKKIKSFYNFSKKFQKFVKKIIADNLLNFENRLFTFKCYLIRIFKISNFVKLKNKRVEASVFKSFTYFLEETNKEVPIFPSNKEHLTYSNIIDQVEYFYKKNNLSFSPGFLYKKNKIQDLFSSELSFHLTSKLKWVPFIYNIQLIKLFNPDNGLFKLEIEALKVKKYFGEKIALLIIDTEENNNKSKYINFNLRDIKSDFLISDINVGDLILFNGNINNKEKIININSNSKTISIIYMHLVCSTNKNIKCQQIGWNNLGPKKYWRPIFSKMPIINIVDKSPLRKRILSNKMEGLNIGGGPNYIKDCINIDTRFGIEGFKNVLPIWIDDTNQFPINSGSLNYVYSSHCFEHLEDSIINHLLKESFRVLRKGGFLQIIVPDVEEAISCYKKNDWTFVKKYWQNKNNIGRIENFYINGNQINLATLTASIICGSSNLHERLSNLGYSCTPWAEEKELHKVLMKGDIKEISDFLNSLIKPGQQFYEHINVFPKETFEEKLKSFGFELITVKNIDDFIITKKIIPYFNKWESISFNFFAQKPYS